MVNSAAIISCNHIRKLTFDIYLKTYSSKQTGELNLNITFWKIFKLRHFSTKWKLPLWSVEMGNMNCFVPNYIKNIFRRGLWFPAVSSPVIIGLAYKQWNTSSYISPRQYTIQEQFLTTYGRDITQLPTYKWIFILWHGQSN